MRKQWRRNRVAFELADEDVPVYPTIASRFDDPGVTRAALALAGMLGAQSGSGSWAPPEGVHGGDPVPWTLIPGQRTGYLGEIAEHGRGLEAEIDRLAAAADEAQQLHGALRALGDARLPAELEHPATGAEATAELARLRELYAVGARPAPGRAARAAARVGREVAAVRSETYRYEVRGKAVTGDNYRETLSGLDVPKVAAPRLAAGATGSGS